MTTKKMFQMSAMIAAFASASFAQQGLKAKIDFPFAAQGVTMEAGTYDLIGTSMTSGLTVYTLRNVETKRSILIPNVRSTEVKAGAQIAIKLVFRCSDASACKLAQIHDGYGQFGAVPSFGKQNKESESLTEVAMTRATARGL